MTPLFAPFVRRTLARDGDGWLCRVRVPGHWMVTGRGRTPASAVERAMWLVSHRPTDVLQ